MQQISATAAASPRRILGVIAIPLESSYGRSTKATTITISKLSRHTARQAIHFADDGSIFNVLLPREENCVLCANFHGVLVVHLPGDHREAGEPGDFVGGPSKP